MKAFLFLDLLNLILYSDIHSWIILMEQCSSFIKSNDIQMSLFKLKRVFKNKLLSFQLSFCPSFIYILAGHLAHSCILLTLSARKEDGSTLGHDT